MKEGNLFSNEAIADATRARHSQEGRGGASNRAARIRRSSLWAAYGDALGWISELTDKDGLRRRTDGAPLLEPVAWTRRIGGRAGINVRLPRGCYSDDSQLRLATGRAISADGFDVEAFAKVELPVWLSYALGAGKATTAAAEHLARPKSSWYANQFKGWTESGGNGAAMRIQPHVWAARTPDDPESFLPNVVRNAICTHSHPTGLMGAVLHALCVGHAIADARCPTSNEFAKSIEVAKRLPEIMANDVEFGYWRVAFEQVAGNLSEAWDGVVEETQGAIRIVNTITKNVTPRDRYKNMVNGLRLRDPARRGSGMLTAVAAIALAWCEPRPAEAMRIAANEVGTDTDTIATMAGAIVGAAADADPPVEVIDADLFRSEADRLAAIAAGDYSPPSHRYPDLLRWLAPASRADALVSSKDGHLRVCGLGGVSEEESEPIKSANAGFLWQWIRLEYGQTLLIKRRVNVRSIDDVDDDGKAVAGGLDVDSDSRRSNGNDVRSRQVTSELAPVITNRIDTRDLKTVLSYVKDHIGSDEEIGRALRQVANKSTPGEIHEFTGKLIDLLRSGTP